VARLVAVGELNARAALARRPLVIGTAAYGVGLGLLLVMAMRGTMGFWLALGIALVVGSAWLSFAHAYLRRLRRGFARIRADLETEGRLTE
jgi:hypothetical protein